MFFAESAIFFEFDAVRGILFIFHVVVVALFALSASQCNFNPSTFSCHNNTLQTKKFTPDTSAKIYYHNKLKLSNVLSKIKTIIKAA